MSKNRRNPHKSFMMLNGILAFAVFVIACLFLYVSFRLKRDADKIVSYEGRYQIELSSDFAGEAISVYLNDSLLLDGIMPDSTIYTCVDRFADESMLMIVDKETDLATSYNLNPDGSRITINKKEGIVSILEVEKE